MMEEREAGQSPHTHLHWPILKPKSEIWTIKETSYYTLESKLGRSVISKSKASDYLLPENAEEEESKWNEELRWLLIQYSREIFGWWYHSSCRNSHTGTGVVWFGKSSCPILASFYWMGILLPIPKTSVPMTTNNFFNRLVLVAKIWR